MRAAEGEEGCGQAHGEFCVRVLQQHPDSTSEEEDSEEEA